MEWKRGSKEDSLSGKDNIIYLKKRKTYSYKKHFVKYAHPYHASLLATIKSEV